VLMEKVDVNGKHAHPVFEYLRRHSKLYDPLKNTIAPISWNFGKFLVGSDGVVINYFEPKDTAVDEPIAQALKQQRHSQQEI